MPNAFDPVVEPRLVYSDESMIVLLKPERMHTAPLSASASDSPNLCDWAFERFPELREAAGSSSRRKGEGGFFTVSTSKLRGSCSSPVSPQAYDSLLAAQNAGNFRKEYLLLAAPGAEEEPRGSRPLRARPLGVPAEDWDAASRTSLAAGTGAEAGLEGLTNLIRAAASRRSPARIRSRFRPYGPLSARVACIGDEGPGGRVASLRRRSRGTGEFYLTELLDAGSPGRPS